MSFDWSHLAASAEAAVTAAMPEIMRWYERADRQVESKADDSPLTAADLAAHRIICEVLAERTPEVAVVSEEGAAPDPAERMAWPCYWLLDPVDGTREFIARNGEFTVNLALIVGQRPLLGVVGVPAHAEHYLGIVPEQRAERVNNAGRVRLRTRPCPQQGTVVVASRHHRGDEMETLLEQLVVRDPQLSTRAVGSALKLVELAAGRADAYPRCGPCSEWDIAAGEAVLEAAGGMIRRRDGQPLVYNKPDTVLNPDFWAVADPEGWLAGALRELMVQASASEPGCR